MCKQSLKNLFVLTLCLTNTLKGILSGMKQSRYDHFDRNVIIFSGNIVSDRIEINPCPLYYESLFRVY